MRDQVEFSAAAVYLFFSFSVQVTVCLSLHAFSIKTVCLQLPQRELPVFTKESDTEKRKKAKLRVNTLLSVVCFFTASKKFNVWELGLWAGGWGPTRKAGGPMNSSTTAACCVCLPFRPAAWTVEMWEHSSWLRCDQRLGHTNTQESVVTAHTHCQESALVGKKTPSFDFQRFLDATCRVCAAESIWGITGKKKKENPTATASTHKSTNAPHTFTLQQTISLFYSCIEIKSVISLKSHNVTNIQTLGFLPSCFPNVCYFFWIASDSVRMFCACFTDGMSIMLPQKVNAPWTVLQQEARAEIETSEETLMKTFHQQENVFTAEDINMTFM